MKQRGRYSQDEFTYDAEEDCYHCPQGKRLTPGVSPRVRAGKRYIVYRSRSADCRACSMRRHCIGEKTQVRSIQRWEHQEVLERHKRRMEQGEEKIRKRGRIVEHPFGTLKVGNGFHQFLMRGLKKCREGFSLMTLTYNFTRVLNTRVWKDSGSIARGGVFTARRRRKTGGKTF